MSQIEVVSILPILERNSKESENYKFEHVYLGAYEMKLHLSR